MNCDEAFEAMTDPAGSRREDLHWHLGLCARCRELRETLAPALASLNDHGGDGARGERAYGECPPAGRSAELPPALRRRSLNFDEQTGAGDAAGRAMFLTDEAVRVAEESAARMAAQVGGPDRRWWSGAVKIAAGLLVGVGITYAALSAATGSPAAPAATPTADATECLWLAPARPANQPSGTVVLSCVTCHLDAH
jgi:hypothetical protein